MLSALNTTLILALFAVMALRPPMPHHSSPFNLQFALGWWINEMPLIGLWWLLAGTISMLIQPRPDVLWWLVASLTAVDVLLLARIALRARSARPALSAAFRSVYGPGGVPRFTRPSGGGSCCRSFRGARTCAVSATSGTARPGAGTASTWKDGS